MNENILSFEKELYTSAGEDVDLGWIETYELLMQQLSVSILRGDSAAVRDLFASIPHNAESPRLRLGPTPLRSAQNLYIIFVHRVTNAAWQAGVPRAICIRLEERYIQQIERISSPEDLQVLLLDASLDLCRRSREYDAPHPSDGLILDAVRFIDNNCTGKLSLRDVAEHLSVSPGHLSRLFHKVTGKPVTSYIRESRVLIACNLLKNTKDSLAEISGSLGFSSQSYFQKVFRETTGMTPKDFRRHGLL